MQWYGDAVVGGKSNDWLVWWQWARQMADWCGGRGQVKWLTNTVMQWSGSRGKSNDWLMWWQWASQMTDWFSGWGKSNDWLMWWQQQVKWLTNVVMQWHSGRGASQMTNLCGGSGQVKWLTDVVAQGKSNDWLMWWQWASQMTDWCSDALSLALGRAPALEIRATWRNFRYLIFPFVVFLCSFTFAGLNWCRIALIWKSVYNPTLKNLPILCCWTVSAYPANSNNTF